MHLHFVNVPNRAAIDLVAIGTKHAVDRGDDFARENDGMGHPESEDEMPGQGRNLPDLTSQLRKPNEEYAVSGLVATVTWAESRAIT